MWEKIENEHDLYEVHDWEKEPMLSGVLIERISGQYDKDNYVIDTGDGRVLVWGKTMLCSLMRDIKIGDRIKITRLGDRPNKKGEKYAFFQVERWINN